MTQNHEAKPFHIIVNAEEKTVSGPTLTFQQVCELAFPNGPFGDGIQYTVTYTGPHHLEGSMVEGGDPVQLANGMIFHVSNTDRS